MVEVELRHQKRAKVMIWTSLLYRGFRQNRRERRSHFSGGLKISYVSNKL